MSKIGIVGAGAWGTALAAAMVRAGNEVVIQALEPEVAEAINKRHENPIYLPGVALDASIHATTKLAAAIDAEMVLLVAPAQYMRAVGEAAAPDWRPGVPAVICAKGIERDSCALMSEVIAEAIPGVAAAVLSGPTFAAEVAIDLPTAVTLACNDELIGKVLMETLSSRNFRIYRSRDVIGAQIGGAVKNVLAIACGIVQGRGLGDNTRAALVTRGLAEMIRLGTAKGARPETLAGLSGLGDLALTCNAMQSRNFSLGVALGEGASLDEVLAGRNSVAEGVFTAASVTELARRLGVEAPICAAVDGVLNHFADIDAAIAGLLSRPLKEETA
ncbi:MAG: NAD(P)H-dependent glycerol-3-phosphate dehydrogenase [Rhodospirillales bacterium]|jgi:glycerol-3-phosphate dehydrogenase (NAD(P)+)